VGGAAARGRELRPPAAAPGAGARRARSGGGLTVTRIVALVSASGLTSLSRKTHRCDRNHRAVERVVDRTIDPEGAFLVSSKLFTRSLAVLVAATAAGFLLPAAASARSSVRVGIGDQSPAMFAAPQFKQLQIKRTRYFVPADVMRDGAERARARAFVLAARSAGVSTLLHVSTADLRAKRGARVSKSRYRRDARRLVEYFRALGVRDFGAWNEVNHKSQETWNRVGYAVSYYKDMYRAVRDRCRKCGVVGLDVLDQDGVERYMRSFYGRLSRTWRKRLKVVGIHNYADVNRRRTSGTRTVIRTARAYNRSTKFWFTETGALASFQSNFRYSEARQASRIKNMFSLASRFKRQGVQRVYSYNWFGIENGGCGSGCRFDAGLVDPSGSPRAVYGVFKRKLRGYSR